MPDLDADARGDARLDLRDRDALDRTSEEGTALMGITNLDQLAQGFANGSSRATSTLRRACFFKRFQTPESSGIPLVTWSLDGAYPAAGSYPAITGAIPDRTTTGGLGQANPTSGKKLYIARVYVSIQSSAAAGVGYFTLYDRLWHNGGMSDTVTVDTSIGSSLDITRNTSDPNELHAEFYEGIGGTASVLTVKYTDVTGATGHTSTTSIPQVTTAGAINAGCTFRLNLQSGDSGVKRPTSYSWNPSTGIANNWGLVIARPLIPMIIVPQPGVGIVRNFADIGMPEVTDDSCIYWYLSNASTVAGHLRGFVDFVEEP